MTFESKSPQQTVLKSNFVPKAIIPTVNSQINTKFDMIDSAIEYRINILKMNLDNVYRAFRTKLIQAKTALKKCVFIRSEEFGPDHVIKFLFDKRYI